VCEVQFFLELTSVTGQPCEMFAVVKRYNTVVRRDQPELGDVLLEARLQDFQSGICVVPLAEVSMALHACLVSRGGAQWLMFTPATSRSSQQVFKVPRLTGTG
jgi:hypothetical protein